MSLALPLFFSWDVYLSEKNTGIPGSAPKGVIWAESVKERAAASVNTWFRKYDLQEEVERIGIV